MEDGNDCRNDCVMPYCGDGLVWNDGDGQEECDDANMSNDDECTSTCTASFCGDGVLWQGMETCDDGNLDNHDACPDSCATAVCGDGYKWNGMEACDDGDQIDDDGCSNTCIGGSGYVFLTSANGGWGFHRYSIADDIWETMTSPPTNTDTDHQ
jgi:cysteine-rich repeat protein